ncbi:putative retrotransposon hot spot protein (RHS) [Trypanosoma cruzi]|uniref:Putative retrotransposon hot spot protein (RHS) n=1 Tax=Trypanosoma cruzi TaxID=5693 RepID=A0A2V2WBX7_TRYCR|nr:putative retrotransposon hot spot protein (RHS) [Trypanosoma cruzi]
MKGSVTALFFDTRIADIFHKACKLHSFICGITVMHRCCGVYDLCFCQGLCAPVLLQSVCGVGGATRVRDRSERDAWANPPCTPRCYYCLLSPTLCWVVGTRAPSLRRSSCMWCALHTVWMTHLLWLPVMSVPSYPISLLFSSCSVVSVQL